MSYRNIKVNDKNYQYTIGKQNVHIKGDGIKSINLAKSEIGELVVVDCKCDCNENNCNGEKTAYKVTPKNIKDTIEKYL